MKNINADVPVAGIPVDRSHLVGLNHFAFHTELCDVPLDIYFDYTPPEKGTFYEPAVEEAISIEYVYLFGEVGVSLTGVLGDSLFEEIEQAIWDSRGGDL
jgi:hypothetical protein